MTPERMFAMLAHRPLSVPGAMSSRQTLSRLPTERPTNYVARSIASRRIERLANSNPSRARCRSYRRSAAHRMLPELANGNRPGHFRGGRAYPMRGRLLRPALSWLDDSTAHDDDSRMRRPDASGKDDEERKWNDDRWGRDGDRPGHCGSTSDRTSQSWPYFPPTLSSDRLWFVGRRLRLPTDAAGWMMLAGSLDGG